METSHLGLCVLKSFTCLAVAFQFEVLGHPSSVGWVWVSSCGLGLE